MTSIIWPSVTAWQRRAVFASLYWSGMTECVLVAKTTYYWANDCRVCMDYMITLKAECHRWKIVLNFSFPLFLFVCVCRSLRFRRRFVLLLCLVVIWKAELSSMIAWITARKPPSVAAPRSGCVSWASSCADELALSPTRRCVTCVDDLWWHLTLPQSSLDESVRCSSGDPPMFFPA